MVDLRTLLAVMLVTDLILAAALWIGVGKRLREELVLWTFSLVAQALAFGLFAMRGQPQKSAIVLGATLLGLSMTLQAAALLTYAGRHLPVWVHTAVIAGVAAPFALMAGDTEGATLFGGVVFGTLLLMLAAISWQLRAPATGEARAIMVTTFALGAMAFYVRGVSVVFENDPAQGFVAPTPFQSALFLVAYAVVLVSSFGFLLLHKERVDASAKKLQAIDSLTGAYSRLSFHEIAEREFSRARRGGQPLSLILLDVDHFEALSAIHGHGFGDAVLKRVAEIVRAALRKEDTMVRFGSEQLLVMLPDVPGPGAVVVAGRIRREVEAEPFEIDARRVPVTVSAGVAARLDEGPESVDSLLERAGEALALAQRRGRNRVVALSLGRSIAA